MYNSNSAALGCFETQCIFCMCSNFSRCYFAYVSKPMFEICCSKAADVECVEPK